MKKVTIVLAVILLGILLVVTVCGMKPENAVNGYSIAYSENNEITYQNHGKNINENSVFELASNGKVVGAYIALKMADEGMLSLDEKIAPHLSSDLLTDDARMKDITIRQLLCHTAGFSPAFELGVDKKIYSDPGKKFRYSGVGYIYLQDVIENVSGMTMEQAAKHYVFEPLGMKNSTFERAKTVTPYMKLFSVVIYALAVFLAAFIVLLLIVSLIGKITKFRFYSFKKGMLACMALASIINILFLMLIFVSKVTVAFIIYLALLGVILLVTRRKSFLFCFSMPVLTIVILILGLTVPVSVPVANDLVARESNCAYTLKSTSEDMAVFCGELMGMKEMFVPAVSIDDVNSWGLGIAIEETESSGTTYWHSGINPGFQSLLVLCPQQDRYMVVLTNSDSGLDFAKNMVRTILGINGEWDIKR